MLRRLASSIGKGLFAGAAGTAAMTISSTIEMKMRGRKPSDAPAKAAGKVLGVSPVGEDEKKRFSNLVHWGYGTGWGAVRGLIGATGLSGLPAGALFFAAIWGNELVMLPSLDVAPPATEWGHEELAVDAGHHLVYATITSLVYEALDP
ncbi:MAG: hypothetical protein M3277_03115 [Actinomycetota bacterium]|nr:hypothetical protein [Actinomycetota bacterium]